MISRYWLAIPTLAVCGAALAADPAKLSGDKQQFSYALGFQVAQGLKQQGFEVDTAAFAQAVEDVLAGKQPSLTMDQMRAAYEQGMEKARNKVAGAASENSEAGKAYLAANKAKPGVVELPSGLQYKVIKAGSGKSPAATDSVTVHYRGTLINGTEFDSSFSRGEPTTFPVNRVIMGWQEALQLMKEGATWQIYVPANLGYGERGAGGDIGPNETLIFDIELIKIN